jgi:hypothetical protein
MSEIVENCVEADEWETLECEIVGHVDCTRRVCPSCGDIMSRECEERSYYWSDLAQLTHALQVAEFNFCMCEDLDGAEPPYADCPREASL